MFAHDLILCSKADAHSVLTLIEAFNTFSQCSGLVANQTNSQVVLGRCNERLWQAILTVI